MLGDDHADDSIAAPAGFVFFQPPLEHCERRRGGLHLRVGDGAPVRGSARLGGRMVGLGFGDVGARRRRVRAAWSSACERRYRCAQVWRFGVSCASIYGQARDFALRSRG